MNKKITIEDLWKDEEEYIIDGNIITHRLRGEVLRGGALDVPRFGLKWGTSNLAANTKVRPGEKIPNKPGAERWVSKKTGKVVYQGESSNVNQRIAQQKTRQEDIHPWELREAQYKLADGRSTSKTRREHERRTIERHNPRFNKSGGGELHEVFLQKAARAPSAVHDWRLKPWPCFLNREPSSERACRVKSDTMSHGSSRLVAEHPNKEMMI